MTKYHLTLSSPRLDKDDFFKNPVSKTDVPDYFDIIKEPMCWLDIDAKLDRHLYWNLAEFRVCLPAIVFRWLTNYFVVARLGARYRQRTTL